MKRVLLLFCFLQKWFLVYSQQWVLDQISEDSNDTEPFSMETFVYGCLFIILLVATYKLGKALKTLSYSMYIRRVKNVIKVMFVIGLAIYSIVSLNTFYKYSKLKEDAEKKLLSLRKRCDFYVTPSKIKDYVSLDEIDVHNFESSDDLIFDVLTHFGLFNNSGLDGVYYCYNISFSPEITILLTNKDIMGLPSDSSNSLYQFVLKPKRIRYFSKNINPELDVKTAFFSFQNDFLNEHMYRFQVVENIDEDVINSLHNEYFELAVIENDDSWDGRKVLYDSDFASQRKYEYKRVNYGNFEIIYSIEDTFKFGIKEHYDIKTYLGFKDSGNISDVEKHATLIKLYTMYFIVALLLVITFVKNRPDFREYRKQNQ